MIVDHHVAKAGRVILDQDEIERINMVRLADRWHKLPQEILRDYWGWNERYCKPASWILVAVNDVIAADAEINKLDQQKARAKARRRRR